ncbi:NACHT domain-containing protein [Streptomyces asiaticus]
MKRLADSDRATALAELSGLLKRLRDERRLTMAALERRSGLGHTTVSQALNGRVVPTVATLLALAKPLKADPQVLLRLRLKVMAMSSAEPSASTEDSAFERRYRDYVISRYRQLTVFGLDLGRPEGACWPLDTAYLSLEMAEPALSHDQWKDAAAPVTVERAEEALARRQRTLVRGLAGSGKTTLLQWLAVSTARGKLPPEIAHFTSLIPFVLPLRTLVRHDRLPPPADFLQATGSMLASAQPAGWAERVLSAGRGLLLVDGIDEVPQGQRENTRTWLCELLAAYPHGHFVVTTRPSAVPEGWLSGLEFTELTVRPMSRDDVSVFISRWHSAASSTLTDFEARADLAALAVTLKDAVRAQRDLGQLATTPLMCALMCALHRDRRGHLPQGRMELYEAALSMLLVRRDRERGIGDPEGIVLTRQQSVHLLQHLAYWLIRNGQTEMDQRDAIAVLDDLLPAMAAVAAQGDASQVLTHLMSRSGLLRQPTAETLDFVHRTFQDYLGAKAAVEARDLGLLTRHAHDDQWEDVIRMAVAHARPAERSALLRRLMSRGDRTARHRTRLHLLAMACLEQATELDPVVRQEVENRTAALLPPRSTADAKTLASVGPVIIDVLPGPEGLEDDEAAAVVRTAAAVGGDAALALIKRFRHHLSHSVQLALVVAWHDFEAHEYAQEILRHIHRPDGLIIVTSEAELEALPGLNQKKNIRVVGTFPLEVILPTLDPQQLTDLDLSLNSNVEDLSFLHSLPRLRGLELFHCPIRDYTPIGGLPLTQLKLYSEYGADELDLSTIGPLVHLTHLELDFPLVHDSMEGFPKLPQLRSLLMSYNCELTSLTGISAYPRLEFLSAPPSLLLETDPAELAALDRLTRMELREETLELLESVSPLPQVTHLTLQPSMSGDALGPLRKTFTGLRSLHICCPPDDDASVDLSPLANIDDLKVTVHHAGHVEGADGFPTGAVRRIPRPRTP